MENDKLKIKTESRILKVSMAGTVTFVLAEVVCAILTHSMALLLDCVFDGTDLLMAIPFLVLVPQLYKPLTEKRPYGYAQVESFFLLIKYSALFFLVLVLVKESVESILNGGNAVEAKTIAIFEFCVSAGCMFMMLLIRSMAKKFMTPTVKAELFLWKLSALSTLGVGIGFLLNIFISHTSLAWIYPYVDPFIAIVCAIFVVKEPVEMIIESVRNLILFPPKASVMARVNEIAGEKCKEYGFQATFCEVIKTGRKYWITVYYYPNAKSVDIDLLNTLDSDLEAALEEELEDVWLEMIMDLLEYRDKDSDN